MIQSIPAQIRYYDVCFNLVDYFVRKGKLNFAVRLSASIEADRNMLLLPAFDERGEIFSFLRSQSGDTEFEREWQIGTKLQLEEIFKQVQIALDELEI
jgi:hypothetical protein